jgi:hypothetical protein
MGVREGWQNVLQNSSGRKSKKGTFLFLHSFQVIAFCDVNPRKVGTKMVLNHETKHLVPVLDWSQVWQSEVVSKFADCETICYLCSAGQIFCLRTKFAISRLHWGSRLLLSRVKIIIQNIATIILGGRVKKNTRCKQLRCRNLCKGRCFACTWKRKRIERNARIPF